MTIQQALSEALVRPEYLLVLDPDRIIKIASNGTLLDARKAHRDYPRLTVVDLMAATWNVLTAEQLEQRAAAIEAELAQRGIALND
jgi:autonomous glycyl radical cofactor GrcA